MAKLQGDICKQKATTQEIISALEAMNGMLIHNTLCVTHSLTDRCLNVLGGNNNRFLVSFQDNEHTLLWRDYSHSDERVVEIFYADNSESYPEETILEKEAVRQILLDFLMTGKRDENFAWIDFAKSASIVSDRYLKCRDKLERSCLEYYQKHAIALSQKRSGNTLVFSAPTASLPLHTAIETRNDDVLSGYLRQNKSLDTFDPMTGRTPLTLALELKSSDAANLLIQVGANPSLEDATGLTPLKIAVFRNDLRAVKEFIKRGVSVSSSLLYAQSTEIIELLCAAGAKVQEEDDWGTPLHYMIDAKNCAPLLSKLLELGADINAPNQFGETALSLAITENKWMACVALIELGASIQSGSAWAEMYFRELVQILKHLGRSDLISVIS